MPTITLSKEELLKTLGEKLSDEELKDRISMLGTDLEGIEGDDIQVEIFPNRPDLLSQQGFGRALASFLEFKTGLNKYTVNKPTTKVIVEKSVAECRPYTSCAIVRGLSLNEKKLKEIITIQEKLHVTYGRNRKKIAIGIYPLEHIKTPIYFRGISPKDINFQPLEAEKNMTAKQILEEHPKGKDYAHLLEGLKKYACFVDSYDKIMSLTPIINSNHTGRVQTNTKDVFIECSGFSFNAVDSCLNMIVTALADMGGKIEVCTVEYQHGKMGTIETPNLTPRKKTISLDYVNKVLGLSLNEKELKKQLQKMGYDYDEKTKEVLIPAYRTDILHQIDFIEDIAIAYGYENFTPVIPNTSTVGEESVQTKYEKLLREILIGHGLIEMKNYHLISKEKHELLMPGKLVTLKNSVSKEFDTMRANPLLSLLLTLTRNKHHEYPQKTFELGKGFIANKKNGHEEKEYLAILLSGEDEDYTKIRQITDSILSALDMTVDYAETNEEWLLEGRAAQISSNGKYIGTLGELHPKTLSKLDITMPSAALLLDVDALITTEQN